MSPTTKSCYLPVGIVSLVLVAVLVLPGCGESPSTVDPKTKRPSTVDPKATQYSTGEIKKSPAVDPDTKRKIDELVDKLKNDAAIVRSSAALALGNMGPAAKEAVPALTEALEDEKKYVRVAAEAALKKINAEK